MAWCQLFCHLAFSITLTTGTSGNQSFDFQKALVALEQGEDFTGAAAMFQTLLQHDPENTEYRFFLGKAYFRMQAHDQAIAAFETCQERDPGNYLYPLWASKAYGRKLNDLNKQGAGMGTLMGWGKKVKAAVARSRELNPESVDVRISYAIFLRETPGLFGGDVDGARDILNEVVAAHPDSINGHFSLAELYLKKKEEYAKALREYQIVAQRIDDPVVSYEDHSLCIKAFLNIGFIYYKGYEDPGTALRYIEQHLSLSPDSQMGYLTLGEILVKEERWTEAREALGKAKKLAAEDDHEKQLKQIEKLEKQVNRKLG